MQENKVLSFNGDAFAELKEDFDSILDKTLTNMQEKNADSFFPLPASCFTLRSSLFLWKNLISTALSDALLRVP